MASSDVGAVSGREFAIAHASCVNASMFSNVALIGCILSKVVLLQLSYAGSREPKPTTGGVGTKYPLIGAFLTFCWFFIRVHQVENTDSNWRRDKD